MRIIAQRFYSALQLDGQKFIGAAYTELLSRQPDQDGLASHLRMLHSRSTKLQVAIGIMQSHEAQALYQQPISSHTREGNSIAEIIRQRFALQSDPFIRQMYQELFSRDADSSGYQAFMHKLQAGHSKHSILIEMLSSNEFASIMALDKHAFAKEILNRLIQSFYSR